MYVRSTKILILTKGGTPVVEGQGVQREGPGQAGRDDGQAAPRYQEVHREQVFRAPIATDA